MSNGFFKELESILDNGWISLTDVCALFAGFCPLEPFGGGWGFNTKADVIKEFLMVKK